MKDIFIERNNYTAIIEKRIRDLKDGYRQNIAIIGDELVGKTTMIFNFLNRFCDNRIIFVYIENRPESLLSFSKRFMGAFFYNFLINSGIPLKEDLDFLIEKSSKFIPKTSQKAKTILASLSKHKRNNIFSELLSLSETLHEETNKYCVIIFDEFHNLEGLGVKNIYSEWSKLLITQKTTMYIILSSIKFKAKTILSKNLSLLFGNFETLAIEPLDTALSENYIEKKLKDTGIDQGLKNFLVHFTGGYPFYLKIITDALLKTNQNNLTGIIEELLFESSGILNQRFSNYLKKFMDSAHSQEYISVLHLIASGHNKIRDIAGIMRKPKKELNTRINHLLELDAITRSGDFLKINDRVFGFWLKFVYQSKLLSMTFDAKNQKELFRRNIENMIKDFLLSNKKSVSERMAEILRLFGDDTIQLERKRLKLSHFREIKPLEFTRGTLRSGLIGRGSDALWIMAFKHEALTEDDITEFAKECKKYHHKLQKKIIVTLSDIDANVCLRALEEKILTWDINNLNQLLDLFSKPRVIA